MIVRLAIEQDANGFIVLAARWSNGSVSWSMTRGSPR
jgi:hypothetical protein